MKAGLEANGVKLARFESPRGRLFFCETLITMMNQYDSAKVPTTTLTRKMALMFAATL
jgi:hypothetical protein